MSDKVGALPSEQSQRPESKSKGASSTSSSSSLAPLETLAGEGRKVTLTGNPLRSPKAISRLGRANSLCAFTNADPEYWGPDRRVLRAKKKKSRQVRLSHRDLFRSPAQASCCCCCLLTAQLHSRTKRCCDCQKQYFLGYKSASALFLFPVLCRYCIILQVRVFLSSTFRDFARERDHLFKNVFPRMEQECAGRGSLCMFVSFVCVISPPPPLLALARRAQSLPPHYASTTPTLWNTRRCHASSLSQLLTAVSCRASVHPD